ncbi:hypothetical protein OpiT1DRAFT_04763 [Opitutaceae bacterium TAV1]|nr:hypothetical protein OpiT1DRAFT_04763 [Opitutaceae bacterium TAV1]
MPARRDPRTLPAQLLISCLAVHPHLPQNQGPESGTTDAEPSARRRGNDFGPALRVGGMARSGGCAVIVFWGQANKAGGGWGRAPSPRGNTGVVAAGPRSTAETTEARAICSRKSRASRPSASRPSRSAVAPQAGIRDAISIRTSAYRFRNAHSRSPRRTSASDIFRARPAPDTGVPAVDAAQFADFTRFSRVTEEKWNEFCLNIKLLILNRL